MSRVYSNVVWCKDLVASVLGAILTGASNLCFSTKRKSPIGLVSGI
jgi:hypothetical protein